MKASIYLTNAISIISLILNAHKEEANKLVLIGIIMWIASAISITKMKANFKLTTVDQSNKISIKK